MRPDCCRRNLYRYRDILKCYRSSQPALHLNTTDFSDNVYGRNKDSQNVRSMMMFEVENLFLVSHSVSGKYAVGVSHASVLSEPELPLCTSDGMSLACRGQNQILMEVGVRSIAYPHIRRRKKKGKCPALVLREEVNEGLAGFTHHPPPLSLKAGPKLFGTMVSTRRPSLPLSSV